MSQLNEKINRWDIEEYEEEKLLMVNKRQVIMVKRQKGVRKSGDRRTNDDDKRTETWWRGVIKKFVSQQVINTRLNEFSRRIDGVEQQIDQSQALKILQSIPEEQQNDYDRIVGALEIMYGHKYLCQVYQTQISSRQQRTNESLQEYEADIERLVHLAYPQAPKTQKCSKLCGLGDTTISDVLVATLEFKAAKEASRNYKPKIASERFRKPQLVDAEWRVSTTYTQCPKISVSKISSDERSLVVHGYLDDKWCSFVIDIGATRTILQPDILPKSSKELSRHVKLETATGELIPVHGELNVKIQLGSKIMYHRVLTADIRDDCILGLDILSKHGFAVDVKDRIIQIQNEKIVMAPKLQDYNQSRKIVVEEDIQISQGSESIVIAKLNGNGEGLSIGIVESCERNHGVLVTRSLVQMNNQILVRIANISDQKIILKKDEVIGFCEPVERVVKCEKVNQAQLNQAKVRDPNITESLLTNAAHLEHEEARKARKFLKRYQDVLILSSRWPTASELGEPRWSIRSLPVGLA
ncbi:hypothetical protein NQ318_013064 [Aromia moschata]|uniref:Peptidase A2 domain-containing protein n=1 Tax=Aromia moschata TaxID=1265417 RepID=A0AAV8XEG7_9CUCU|nr:hypothetical protein NQ318_013064 [Aromia moschata]